MNAVLVEVLIIFLLLLANGVFAMTEIAVVSSRKARLKKLADGGSAGATAALGADRGAHAVPGRPEPGIAWSRCC